MAEMKLVPVEPMPEMLAAFWRQKNTGSQEPGQTGEDRSDYAAYRAMLAASAQAPAREEVDDHHERNLTATNAELIEQAFSHPPLEAPRRREHECTDCGVDFAMHRPDCAALTPREEAPAEGAGDDLTAAREWLRVRWAQDWPNEGHVKQLADYAAHLRARTSEPEAGAVAWRGDGQYVPTQAMVDAGLETNHRSNPPHKMIASFQAMMQQAEIDGLISYTAVHPSPATADKLRVAREALEGARDAFAEIVTKDIHHSGPNLDTDVMREGDVSSTWVGDLGRMAKLARKAADQALATLSPKEEGGE